MLFVTIPQQTDVDFDAFWQAYPLHKARRDAEKAWRQVKGADHLTAILAAIEAQKAERRIPGWHPAWPYPASWLRAKRWEDEIALSARLTLDGACPRCGSSEGLCRDIKACNANWLQQQRASAATASGRTTGNPQ